MSKKDTRKTPAGKLGVDLRESLPQPFRNQNVLDWVLEVSGATETEPWRISALLGFVYAAQCRRDDVAKHRELYRDAEEALRKLVVANPDLLKPQVIRLGKEGSGSIPVVVSPVHLVLLQLRNAVWDAGYDLARRGSRENPDSTMSGGRLTDRADEVFLRRMRSLPFKTNSERERLALSGRRLLFGAHTEPDSLRKRFEHRN